MKTKTMLLCKKCTFTSQRATKTSFVPPRNRMKQKELKIAETNVKVLMEGKFNFSPGQY